MHQLFFFFSHRVAVVQRFVVLLQAVEVFHIVLALIGCINYSGVHLLPRLNKTNN